MRQLLSNIHFKIDYGKCPVVNDIHGLLIGDKGYISEEVKLYLRDYSLCSRGSEFAVRNFKYL
jgi:hypothetical protein